MAAYKNRNKRKAFTKRAQSERGLASHNAASSTSPATLGLATSLKKIKGVRNYRAMFSASDREKIYHLTKTPSGSMDYSAHASGQTREEVLHFSANEYNEVWRAILSDKEESATKTLER